MCSQNGLGPTIRDNGWIEGVKEHFQATGQKISKNEVLCFDIIDELQEAPPGSITKTGTRICDMCFEYLIGPKLEFLPVFVPRSIKYVTFCSAECFAQWDIRYDPDD